jgi:hypothetical protein
VSHGKLRSGNGVSPRRVDDDDSSLGGGFDIDRVDAGTRPTHDFESFSRLENFTGDSSLAPHEETVVGRDGIDELLLAHFRSDIYACFPFEDVDPFSGNGIRNEHRELLLRHNDRPT